MAENVMNKLGLFGSNVPGLLDKGLANLYDRNALIGLESRYGNQYGLEQTGTGIGSDARHMAAMNELSKSLSPFDNKFGSFIGDTAATALGALNELLITKFQLLEGIILFPFLLMLCDHQEVGELHPQKTLTSSYKLPKLL